MNTVEEEQNLTNFLILVDYVISLKQSWDTQRKFFDRVGTDEPFLGTHLVLLSRSLAVVAEATQEVYLTMDSVFLGPAERQTIELDFAGKTIPVSATTSFTFPSTTPPLFVAELLEWVDRFASEEAPPPHSRRGESRRPRVLPDDRRAHQVDSWRADSASRPEQTAGGISDFPYAARAPRIGVAVGSNSRSCPPVRVKPQEASKKKIAGPVKTLEVRWRTMATPTQRRTKTSMIASRRCGKQ